MSTIVNPNANDVDKGAVGLVGKEGGMRVADASIALGDYFVEKAVGSIAGYHSLLAIIFSGLCSYKILVGVGLSKV